MKRILLSLLIAFPLLLPAQDSISEKFKKADQLVGEEKLADALAILERIEKECDQSDTLYDYILWRAAFVVSELEQQARMKEDFSQSLKFGLQNLAYIEKGKPRFDSVFATREPWARKNLVVSYFGLGKADEAKQQMAVLYKGYKEKTLPKGIDRYFNFRYFKWEGKNIWGYEWFPELGDPETEGSFSKVVYYVYSTKPDGSDDKQLYRLHVLKFHKFDDSVPFDYVLTKRLETATSERSGTLYDYTYKKKLDYAKLEADIRAVLAGKYEIGASTETRK